MQSRPAAGKSVGKSKKEQEVLESMITPRNVSSIIRVDDGLQDKMERVEEAEEDAGDDRHEEEQKEALAQ